MQQMYELWLQLTNQSRRTDSSVVTPPPEDKQVTITADYTESMVSGCSNPPYLSVNVAFVFSSDTADNYDEED